jgi:glucosamine--fructose-6-phosphate aminotransferase (isomerizing)
MNQRIGYRDAVARQPESLEEGRRQLAAALETLDLLAFAGKSVAFAGIGASYQAGLVGAAYLRQLGIPSFCYFPTELFDGLKSAAQSFVALSASGQSREIAEVMRAEPAMPKLAVCRSADTPLAAITGRQLAYHSGADNGASSTGYTGMLLALGMLGDRLAGRPLDAAWTALPGAVAALLSGQADAAERAGALLANRTAIDIVGAGAAFATAGEAAMLIREAVRVPAQGWDTLNYLHGPMESQDSRTGLIALGDGREVKIATDVAGFGCPSVLITTRTDVPRAERLVVLTIPRLGNSVAEAILQIVAAQLAIGVMQDAAGLTDITFRYRQTDTKLKPWSPTEV